MDLRVDRIVLGTGFNETPQGVWYPYIAEIAKEHKLTSIIPVMPNPGHPNLRDWQATIIRVANESPRSTILVAHSLGCTNMLHFLDAYNGQQKFPLLILVAPPVHEVGYDEQKEFFAESFKYSTLHEKVEKVVVIITPDDPVLKPDPLQHGLLLVNGAGAKLIVLKNGKHFSRGDDFNELKVAMRQEINALHNVSLGV